MSLSKVEYGPVAVVLYGPPTVGKSTLGEMLSRRTNLVHLDIDGQAVDLQGILSGKPRNWCENSAEMAVKYALLHARATSRLLSGEPVVLTATYSHGVYEHALRSAFIDTYQRFACLPEPPLRVFELDASPETIVTRMADRIAKGSASNVVTLEEAVALRQKFVHMTGEVIVVDTGLQPEQNIAQIMGALESFRKA